MSEEFPEPTLNYFRATPVNLLGLAPLASSLQSLETTFFLIALGRFPSALTACATAWESAIKAKPSVESEDYDGLEKLIKKARKEAPNLNDFEGNNLKEFRETRNNIVHYGYSPKDDSECARLLVEVGLPFLTALYRELFDFYINWRDIRPDVDDFSQLSESEMDKVGLIPDYADQLQIVYRMHALNRKKKDFDPLLCFTVFAHYIRYGLNAGSYASSVADRVFQKADEIGIRFEVEEEERERLAREFGDVTWKFTCPVCSGWEGVVALLDENAIKREAVQVKYCACVSCRLVIPATAYRLADLVMEDQLKEQTPQILEAYVDLWNR